LGEAVQVVVGVVFRRAAEAGEYMIGLLCQVAVAVVIGVAQIVQVGAVLLHARVPHLSGATAVDIVAR